MNGKAKKKVEVKDQTTTDEDIEGNVAAGILVFSFEPFMGGRLLFLRWIVIAGLIPEDVV